MPNSCLLEATHAERPSHVLDASGLEGMAMIPFVLCADAYFGCYLSALSGYHTAELFDCRVSSRAVA
jgi:hypothetical protein